MLNPTTWNRYAYVNGDPINFNDPTGLCEEDDETTPCDVAPDLLGGGAGGWDAGGGGGGGGCDPEEGCYEEDATGEQPTGIDAKGNPIFWVNSLTGGQLVQIAGMWSPIDGQPPNTFFILPRGMGPVIRVFQQDGTPVDIHYQPNHPEVGDPHIHYYPGGEEGPHLPVPPGSRIPPKPVVPPNARGPYSPWA